MVDVKARIAALNKVDKANQPASGSKEVQPATAQGIRNGQPGLANQTNRVQFALPDETVRVPPASVDKINIIQSSFAQKTVNLQPMVANETNTKQSTSDKGTGKVPTAPAKDTGKQATETNKIQSASDKGTIKSITETNSLQHAPPKETSKPTTEITTQPASDKETKKVLTSPQKEASQPTTEPTIMQYAPAQKAGKPTFGTNIMKSAHKGAVQVSNNRFRTTFKEGESLVESEGITIEYKNYRWPFPEEMNVILKATINSFLNNQGGRIYIGVTDEGIVRGIKLSLKEEDNLIQHISWLVKFFEPPIQNNDLVRIRFIGITNQRGKVIPGRFVVKIIVKQGDPSELYSVSDEFFNAYFRKDRQTFPALKTREIKELMLKRRTSPGEKIKTTEFDDPEPEPIKHFKGERIDFRQSPVKQIKQNRSEDEEEEKNNEDEDEDKENNKEKIDEENYSYAIEEVKRDGYRTKGFDRYKDNKRSKSHFRDKSRDKNGY